MKNNTRNIFLLLVIALMSLTLLAQISHAKEPMNGAVIKVYRDTYFQDQETGEWKKAVEGMYVTRGHALKTGDKASMIIELTKSYIRLESDTEIRLTEFSGENIGGGLLNKWEDTTTVIDVIRGKIYIKVEELSTGDTFQVRKGLSAIETKEAEFSVAVYEAPVPEDHPDAFDFVKLMHEKSDVPEHYTIMSGKITAVVVEGTVSFTSFDTNGMPKGAPVTVNEGEASEASYMYIVE
jgi:hypothetical protein